MISTHTNMVIPRDRLIELNNKAIASNFNQALDESFVEALPTEFKTVVLFSMPHGREVRVTTLLPRTPDYTAEDLKNPVTGVLDMSQEDFDLLEAEHQGSLS